MAGTTLTNTFKSLWLSEPCIDHVVSDPLIQQPALLGKLYDRVIWGHSQSLVSNLICALCSRSLIHLLSRSLR